MIEEPFKKPPPSGDFEAPPKPKRYWWRFLLAGLVIIAATGTATAVSALLYVDSIANALSHNNVLQNKVQRFLAETNGGEPENILILGSDKRASEPEDTGRSDTTILLRLDPDQSTISLISIPRDLKVEIPGVGTAKFNEAYAVGGPKLTLQVVKELTGLPINHVVNVDYLGFVRAVDAIGCVYVDVDRRYYHSNAGLPPSEQYSEINIKPGYQLLCGKKALQYVRYRHTDTDLVRSARQQDFLSDARERVPIADLVLDKHQLIDIFTEYTTSDISDAETMLQVLKLFVASRNATINEVNFPAELGPSYVYSSPEMIEEAIEKFLGSEASGGPRGSLDEPSRSGGGKKKNKKKKSHPSKPKLKAKPPGDDGLVPAREAGELEAAPIARKVSRGFPVFYPTRLPSGAVYEETDPYEHIVDPRVYHLKDQDGNRHGAYRMVATLELPDGVHYFGVQGIQGWSDPPILNDPSLTETIHGREYDIFLDGDRIKMIAWHRGDNTYWVSNSVLRVLTNDQMVGIARSAKVKIPNQKRKNRTKATR
ncbi:MAG TPA: LCP family protein [Solirubrobacterales bacterium]|jgi:LCP family protein required for cell wall assembly|nr:LCP family protein [Solirubrobacterales bacterium]